MSDPGDLWVSHLTGKGKQQKAAKQTFQDHLPQERTDFVRRLIGLLSNDKAKLRDTARELLCTCTVEEIFPVHVESISRLLISDEPGIYKAAFELFQRANAQIRQPCLTHAGTWLNDADEAKQLTALTFLARCPAEELALHAPAIRALLKHTSRRVVAHAIETIASCGATERAQHADTMIQLLRDPSRRIQRDPVRDAIVVLVRRCDPLERETYVAEIHEMLYTKRASVVLRITGADLLGAVSADERRPYLSRVIDLVSRDESEIGSQVRLVA